MRLPPWLVRGLAAAVRPVHAVAKLEGQYHPESLRVVAGATYYADNAKARSELGYAPRPLEEGLPHTLAAELERMGREVPDRLQQVLNGERPARQPQDG